MTRDHPGQEVALNNPLVQVEASDDGVVVRTSRDTFSAARKEAFVRELAAEGFIADAYRWLPAAVRGAPHGVRWLVDISCFRPSPRRVMVRTRPGSPACVGSRLL